MLDRVLGDQLAVESTASIKQTWARFEVESVAEKGLGFLSLAEMEFRWVVKSGGLRSSTLAIHWKDLESF
jgi:hypothetical protein